MWLQLELPVSRIAAIDHIGAAEATWPVILSPKAAENRRTVASRSKVTGATFAAFTMFNGQRRPIQRLTAPRPGP